MPNIHVAGRNWRNPLTFFRGEGAAKKTSQLNSEKNSHDKDFGLPTSVNVSYVSLSYSIDVYDREKNFMFALIKIQRMFKFHALTRFTNKKRIF